MLKYGDAVGVALSGGKDSTSLLHVLNEVTRGHGTKLYAITIDEGIGGYREEAVEKSAKLAEKLGIPLLVASYKEFFGFTLDEALSDRGRASGHPAKVTSCAVCGPLRRRSIDLAAERLGVDVVATAHNLDDVLQTFFINLYAGDIDRIRWLDPEANPRERNNGFKMRRIKPFLEIYEQELAFFAYLNDLPFQSESCPYMNEGIRTEIRTSLNALETRHPGIKYSTLSTVLQIARGLGSRIFAANLDASVLPNERDVRTGKSATRCKKCGSVSSGEICSVCQALKTISAWKMNA
jgi:cytoplasmic tRNA 2-thiolation protein 1